MGAVEDYVNTQMVMRDSTASILEVAKSMVDWGISSVAITDKKSKKVIGILTERDIVNSIAKGGPPDGITAGSLMSSHILSIRSDQPIEEAALLMIRNKVRHLLVEDPSRIGVIGIITTTDLARYLKHTMKQTGAAAKENENERSSELLTEVWELYF
jgi:signal-transduction protein with cAMP-binding, CBS, and nucleotidyltransferase domain